MSASTLPSNVVPMRKTRSRQTSALQIELDSRRVEERRFARDAEPLLRRLAFAAVELGPAAEATVQHLSYLHYRHRARWQPQGEPEDAA